jgi:hypothetical protein
VVQHYERLIGGRLDIDTPGTSVMVGTNKFVIDDSKDRPVQVRVFVHYAEKHLVTVVVSRAKGEKETHVAIVVKESGK